MNFVQLNALYLGILEDNPMKTFQIPLRFSKVIDVWHELPSIMSLYNCIETIYYDDNDNDNSNNK